MKCQHLKSAAAFSTEGSKWALLIFKSFPIAYLKLTFSLSDFLSQDSQRYIRLRAQRIYFGILN